ncbi:MAG: hypothetical protein PWR01_1302 [Clostridiales bacterium]|nr:hypothetical protein [Clostridiales bacterium]
MFSIQSKLKMSCILFRFILSQDMVFIKRKLGIKKYFGFYVFCQCIAFIFFLLATLLLRFNFNELVFFLFSVIFIISMSLAQLIEPGGRILSRYKYDYFKTAFSDENMFARYLMTLHYFIRKIKMIAYTVPIYILIGMDFGFRGIIILLIIECISFLVYKIRRILEYNVSTIISFFYYVVMSVIILFISYYVATYIILLMTASRNLISYFGGITQEYWEALETTLISEIAFLQRFFAASYRLLFNILRDSNILLLLLLLCLLFIVIYITKNISISLKTKQKYPVFCYKIIGKNLGWEETSNAIFFKDANIVKNYRLNSWSDFISLIFPKENFIYIGGFFAVISQVNNPLIPIVIFHIIMLASISAIINTLKVTIKDVFDYRSDSKLIPILRGAVGNMPQTIFFSKVKLAINLLYIPLLARAIPLLIISAYFLKANALYLIFSLLFLKIAMVLLVKFHLSGDLRVFLLEYNSGTIDSDQYLVEDTIGYSLLKGYAFVPVYILNMSVNLILLFTGFFKFFHGIHYAVLIILYSLIYFVILFSANYNLKLLLRRYEDEEAAI